MTVLSTPARTMTAVGAAAVAVTAAVLGSAVWPATGTTAAAHSSSARDISFVSVTRSHHDFSRTRFVDFSVDKRHGEVIGYETAVGTVHPDSGELTFHLTFAFERGSILADFGSDGGTILGGTGAYSGVRGTVTATASDDGSRRHGTLHLTR